MRMKDLGITNSFLKEYYDKCKTGEILIGHELMMQLEMLMDEFQNPFYHHNKQVHYVVNEYYISNLQIIRNEVKEFITN
jgi:hypothetical protein